MERTGKKNCNKGFVWYVKRSKGFIDWIDLSNLPRKKRDNVLCTDWKSINNNKVIAKYKNKVICFTLVNKVNEKTIVVNYKDKIIPIYSDNLKKCHLGNITGGRVIEYRYSKGDVVNNHIVLERMRIEKTTSEKGYKVKCLITNKEYEITEYILKDIEKSKYAKMLYYTNYELVKYFKDVEVTKKITYSSSTYHTLVCPNCKEEKNMKVSNLYNKGLSCLKCSNYISYPEKLMLSILTLNEINYIRQYTIDSLKQDKLLRFDFYLPEHNTIIEVHGRQHYKDIGWGIISFNAIMMQ